MPGISGSDTVSVEYLGKGEVSHEKETNWLLDTDGYC